MTSNDEIRELVDKWTLVSKGYRVEMQRLESADRSRHATSIAMLDASAQAIDRCAFELERMIRIKSQAVKL
jgi:hypothetical protein